MRVVEWGYGALATQLPPTSSMPCDSSLLVQEAVEDSAVASGPSMLSPSSPEHDLGVVGVLKALRRRSEGRSTLQVRWRRALQGFSFQPPTELDEVVAASLSNGRSVGSFVEQWQL